MLSVVSYEELCTLLTEVETVINSCPLTYVSDNQDGISSVLTPSHLINGRRITTTPNDHHFEIVSTFESLTKKVKHHRHLLTQFTKQWKNDYLFNLRENHTVKMRRSEQPAVKTGDVVIVKDDVTKRLFWKLAVVTDVIRGNNNQIRAAVVRVADPQGKTSLLRRSIKHLYPRSINVTLLCNQGFSALQLGLFDCCSSMYSWFTFQGDQLWGSVEILHCMQEINYNKYHVRIVCGDNVASSTPSLALQSGQLIVTRGY